MVLDSRTRVSPNLLADNSHVLSYLILYLDSRTRVSPVLQLNFSVVVGVQRYWIAGLG